MKIRMRYRAPKEGTPVEFEVQAEHPVMTYIVRPRGLELFDEGKKNFRYYGGFQTPPRMKHKQELMLPFSGPWYLVIVNPDEDEPVKVHYEVYY